MVLIRLTQLSTGLKVEAELGNKKIYWFQFFDLILDHKKFSGPKKSVSKKIFVKKNLIQKNVGPENCGFKNVLGPNFFFMSLVAWTKVTRTLFQ